MGLVGKHMDVVPPLGWNWTDDDWRMYNFFRDLESHGGVVSGELNDRFVLLRYNRKHPALSFVIQEVVPKASATIHINVKVDAELLIDALAQVAKAVVRSYHGTRS
jgi:hypothetical protein